MFLEATLSCTCLLLTCGSSIYVLYKYSYNEYSTLTTPFIFAFIGFTTLGIRPLYSLIYKLFFKSYTLNLTLIETEEMENKKKINIFDEFLKNISKSSLMCSLFFHHGDYLLACNTAISFFLCNMLHLKYWILENQNENSNISLSYKRSIFNAVSELFVFLELLTTAFVMLLNDNNYGLLANLFYAVTTILFPSEGFYQEWTINDAINNYLTMAYVVLMTEALKKI
ncbi:uncharacterized protein LOC122632043 isoform X1 [Vespula pensylvanica]|uniref:Uncharacterized protein n=1 Tax=Vespula pensylvanica TaxID=30213 RepID=A0A834PH21_VESPE|nr:uncharacterized protein LOC122632043 isoform X1 [Vespula pensylvanica]KAF7439599.1 hypothetical protein H0235_001990 [Vespula pensylvanica]